MNIFSVEKNTFLQENPDQGKIILLHQNFADINQIPQNFFLGSISGRFFGEIYSFFFGEQKSIISHNKEKCIILTSRRINFFPWLRNIHLFLIFNLVQFDLIKKIFKIFFLNYNPKNESLFICKFVPMTKCEYIIELEKPSEKGFVIIQTPGGNVIIDRKNFGEYYIDSYYRDPSEKFKFKRMIIPTKDGKISLKILFDGITKTNTISCNDQNPIVTPFNSTSRSQLKNPSFSSGYIKITNIALPNQETSTFLLYSISQSASRKLITPIGEKNSQPFGFDGPHSLTTIQNGLLYMKKFGYRGTIWFDILYIKDDDYTAFLKSLIQNEFWETGIHYSKSLNKLSSSIAYELISDEFETISSQLDTPPKSWCSLRNGDNVNFANYVYDKFKMIWRNGDTGIHSERIVGNLDDATWEWWNSASKSGLIYPAFTHQTDKEPAMRFSISYSNFKTWIDNYQSNGISIIPFNEWWHINANTNDTRITNISINNHTLKFQVRTNGEKGLVNVCVSPEPDLVIMDHQTNEKINWSDYGDNSITFYVQSNHEYEIKSQNIKNSFNF
jgi:hypothetical protein